MDAFRWPLPAKIPAKDRGNSYTKPTRRDNFVNMKSVLAFIIAWAFLASPCLARYRTLLTCTYMIDGDESKPYTLSVDFLSGRELSATTDSLLGLYYSTDIYAAIWFDEGQVALVKIDEFIPWRSGLEVGEADFRELKKTAQVKHYVTPYLSGKDQEDKEWRIYVDGNETESEWWARSQAKMNNIRGWRAVKFIVYGKSAKQIARNTRITFDWEEGDFCPDGYLVVIQSDSLNPLGSYYKKEQYLDEAAASFSETSGKYIHVYAYSSVLACLRHGRYEIESPSSREIEKMLKY